MRVKDRLPPVLEIPLQYRGFDDVAMEIRRATEQRRQEAIERRRIKPPISRWARVRAWFRENF